MKQLTHYETALHHASIDTSRLMSAHLRSETAASGWPHEVTRHMGIHYNGEEFKVHNHPGHTDDVHRLEYGYPGSQPTAAIRRFGNRTHEAETFLTKRLFHYLGREI